MKFMTSRITRFVASLALVFSLVAFSSISAFAAAPGASSTPVGNSASATLSAGGGWVAYTFSYPGDNSQIEFDLTYNADASTEVDNAITMDVYGPDAPPNTGGAPIGSATWSAFGKRAYILDSSTSGTYTLIIHNWDPSGEPLAINLTSTDISVSTSTPGPELSVLSASAGTIMNNTPAAPATTTTAPESTQSSGGATMSTPGSSSVSHALPAGGGWVVYSFNYAGDNTPIEFDLSTNPADNSTEVENSIVMQAYGPDGPLNTGSAPVGTASWSSFGHRTWTLDSNVAGTYTIIIHNWNPSDEQVTVNLTGTDTSTSTPGPALTMLSAMQ